MRILFLLTQDIESPSGLGRYLPLAKELVRKGHRVHMAALHPAFEALPRREFTVQGVRVRYVAPMQVKKTKNEKSHYPPMRLLSLMSQATWKLAEAIRHIRPEVIHLGKPHPMNSLAALMMQSFVRARIFLDCDDYEAASGHFNEQWQKWIVSFFERWVPLFAHRVTTNTHFMNRKLQSWGVPAEQITLLPNGVDRDRFATPDPTQVASLRHHLGLENKRVVAYIGSLSRPSHPLDLLLEAFLSVHQVIPESVLMLVGGGEDLPRLEQRAAQLGLNQVVCFCGRVHPDQVVLYYHLADVSVDPVEDDDIARGRSPLKLFESWACGVPFVTGKVGDRDFLLGDPPAGILVPPGDPQALAAGLLDVLTNPQLSKVLQARGRSRVQDYHWDQLITRLEPLYLA